MKKQTLVFIFCVLIFPACFNSKVDRVKPELFSSLPENVRHEALAAVQEKEAKLHVLQGKVAKAHADLQGVQQEVRDAEKDVAAKKAEITERKVSLKELKKSQGNPHEIAQLNQEIDLLKQHLQITKEIARFKRQNEKVAEEEITVLESRQKVLESEVELTKIKAVHQYTNFSMPQADLQIANYNEQVRKYEVDESIAKHHLAKEEQKVARQKHKIYLLKKKLPDGGTSFPEDKTVGKL